MVPGGNPKGITGWQDLGRPGVRVIMPNPEAEGIGRLIVRAMEKTGGRELVDAVMKRKMAAGETVLSRIHHRETPLYLLDGRADAGPVWVSEGLYQKRIGSGLDQVTIPDAQNQAGTYFIAILEKTVQHRAAAEAFLGFMRSREVREIYAGYGFGWAG